MDIPNRPPAATRKPFGFAVKPAAAGGGPSTSPGSVTAADLDEFAQSEEARRVEQLERDAELVHRLMWRGYAGPEWTEFARALAGYGVHVVGSWVISGMIFIKCRGKGIGLERREIPRGRQDRRDDAQELANETVARAIVAFREKVLIPGRWDPAKGASLKTFFIGQCLFQFPNVYRAWLTEVAVPQCEGVLPEMLLPASSDAENTALLASEVRTLSPNDPRALALLVEMGYTQAQIAEMEGTTWRAIESRLHRAKKKVRNDGR